jgi:hypothetical protein
VSCHVPNWVTQCPLLGGSRHSPAAKPNVSKWWKTAVIAAKSRKDWGGSPRSASLLLGMLSNKERAEGGLSLTLLMKRFLRIITLIFVPVVLFAAILNRDKPDIAFQVIGAMFGFLVMHCFFCILERLFRHLAS